MTSLNLATIFGPNLLHKQKTTDKEFTVQSTARAEESAAIITVVQKMVENYEMLFMVCEDFLSLFAFNISFCRIIFEIGHYVIVSF